MNSDLIKLAFDLPFMSEEQRNAFTFDETGFRAIKKLG